MRLPLLGWVRWRASAAVRGAVALAALCAAWFGCSALGNVVGKLLLSEFPRPATVAMAQLAATAALSTPCVACERRPAGGPGAGAGAGAGAGGGAAPALRVLLPLALAKFLTALCSQVSLWKVPVSYAHTVKATTPLWTAGLARLLFGERLEPGVAPALLLVAGGVALASATELQFDCAGLAAALAAAALLALQHLYAKRLLAGAGWSPLRALRALSALAAALFAPAWLLADGGALRAGALGGRAALLLAADAALAWLQAAAAFSVLARVTPLTYAVLSCGKRVLVVGASLLALRNPAPPLNLAGMLLAAAAVLQYNRAKLRARRARAHSARAGTGRAPLLPV